MKVTLNEKVSEPDFLNFGHIWEKWGQFRLNRFFFSILQAGSPWKNAYGTWPLTYSVRAPPPPAQPRPMQKVTKSDKKSFFSEIGSTCRVIYKEI